jgi:hypothetical protein
MESQMPEHRNAEHVELEYKEVIKLAGDVLHVKLIFKH